MSDWPNTAVIFRKRSRTGQRGSRHRAITLLVNDRQQLCGLHCLEH
jgi:hypothetical protein